MKPISKFEAIGIFASVAVMAVALLVVRYNGSDLQLFSSSETQTGAVVVASDDGAVNETGLAKAIYDSATIDGELKKLIINDVTEGSGTVVREGDTVTVDYIGTTQSGIKFDSSYDRGETFTFTVGEGKVIEGWEKGLLGMKVGGQRILVIPSDMAYGDRTIGPIPAGSTLVFAVELHEIN